MTKEPSSAKEWLAELRALGDKPVDAIVRVAGDPETRVADVKRCGLDVRRTLRLVRGLAVHGPASALCRLAEEPWVLSVEPDLPVRTLSQEDSS